MNIHTSKHKCTVCGKCCGTNDKLATHRRSHSGEKPSECTVCSKRFTTSGNLVQHSRIHSEDMRVHTGDKPYKCHMCDKAFSKSGDLNSHMRVHTGDTPYSCRHCSECFIRPDQLETHLLKSHNEGTWFVCNVWSSCVYLLAIVAPAFHISVKYAIYTEVL